MMKLHIFRVGLFLLYILLGLALNVKSQNMKKYPNIIIIIADDMGIGDVGCFGNHTIKTPNIDRLAKEGVILHHHLAVESLCTPSRAALLTGRYPAKYGLAGEEGCPPVIAHVASKVGLPDSETTIAGALSSFGYATALVGKWHLGSGCNLFGTNCLGPLAHGFEFFYGLPLTLIEDMDKDFPFWIYCLKDTFYQAHLSTSLALLLTSAYLLKKRWWKSSTFMLTMGILVLFLLWFLYTHYRLHTERWWQVSPWMNNNFNGVIMKNSEVVHRTVPFRSIFQELVDQSVEFIRLSSEVRKPFFLIHSFAHVHIPMFSSPEFSGRSAHGRYGDNVEEMDSGIGTIMNALKKNDLDDDTLIYFVSDHGGHLEAVDPVDGQRIGGYNKEFKGGKGMGAAEGGIRVPGIIRWKGVLPSGTQVDTPTVLLDIFPTVLDLAGLPQLQEIFPNAEPLDGLSFAHLLRDPNARVSMERVLIHHCGRNIHGLRLIKDSKIYKLYNHIPRWKAGSFQCGWGETIICGCSQKNNEDLTNSPLVYELISDPFEDRPLDARTREYKEVILELMSYLRNWKKNNIYPPSQFCTKWNTVLSPWLQPF